MEAEDEYTVEGIEQSNTSKNIYHISSIKNHLIFAVCFAGFRPKNIFMVNF